MNPIAFIEYGVVKIPMQKVGHHFIGKILAHFANQILADSDISSGLVQFFFRLPEHAIPWHPRPRSMHMPVPILALFGTFWLHIVQPPWFVRTFIWVSLRDL